MGDPSNRNQNHLVHGGRSTSRVLAPPGGASSLSLGGYGGVAEYDSRSNRGLQNSKASLSNKSSFEERAPYESRKYEQQPPRSNIASIPGLEGHYGGSRESYDSNSGPISKQYSTQPSNQSFRRKQGSRSDEIENASENMPYSASMSTNRNSRGPMNGQDYASLLREQIELKKRIDEDAGVYDRRGSKGNRPNFPPQNAVEETNYAYAGAGSRASVINDPFVSQQTRMKSIADERHDRAMEAYNARGESEREKDYRRMQNNSEPSGGGGSYGGSNYGGSGGAGGGMSDLYTQNSNTASNPPQRRRSGQFSQDGSSGPGQGQMAAALRGDLNPVQKSSRGHAPGGGKNSFSIGWN